jgi:predicted metalloenzyme YecM
MNEISSAVAVHKALEDLRREFNTKIMELEIKLESGFPGADFDKHHADHRAIHVRQEQWRKLWETFWVNSVQGASGALIVVIVIGTALLIFGKH